MAASLVLLGQGEGDHRKSANNSRVHTAWLLTFHKVGCGAAGYEYAITHVVKKFPHKGNVDL